MAGEDLLGQAGNAIGLDKWNIGLGTVGTFMVWFFIIILFGGGLAGFIVYKFYMKQFKHKIIVFGLMGNIPQKRWEDKAKEVRMGRAGDFLFYLKSKKRFISPPELQSGPNEWWYWEREDGELINVRPKDMDKEMKTMGLHFIHSDMRMQRLGIEKNLQFRTQKEGFWDKHGDKIINVVFYMFIFLTVVIVFTQLGKVIEKIAGVAGTLDTIITKTCTQPQPETPGGLVPAFALSLLRGIG